MLNLTIIGWKCTTVRTVCYGPTKFVSVYPTPVPTINQLDVGDMSKKTVFFFCYRMMEFKLFLSGEILSEVTKFARLVVFVPEEFCENCASICPDDVIVRPIRHPSFKLGTVSQIFCHTNRGTTPEYLFAYLCKQR